jgi:hypothetical protein
VSFTAFELAQEPPATSVADALGLAVADADVLVVAVEVLAGAEVLLPPLLQAASAVAAATAAIDAVASRGDLLLVVLFGNISRVTPLYP